MAPLSLLLSLPPQKIVKVNTQFAAPDAHRDAAVRAAAVLENRYLKQLGIDADNVGLDTENLVASLLARSARAGVSVVVGSGDGDADGGGKEGGSFKDPDRLEKATVAAQNLPAKKILLSGQGRGGGATMYSLALREKTMVKIHGVSAVWMYGAVPSALPLSPGTRVTAMMRALV